MKNLRQLPPLFITLCMAFAMVPAAQARTGASELLGVSVNLPVADTATVKLSVEEGLCTLLAALYDENGALLTAGMTDVTGGGEQEVSMRLPAGGAGYAIAKAFLVDAGTKEPLCPCVSITAAEQRFANLDLPDSWKEELLRADAMGFPMERLEQSTVSGREMAALLDRLVDHAAPEKLAEWRALLPEFAAYEGPLTRFDAMAALFLAAQTIGDRWAEPVESINQVWNALDMQWDFAAFSPELFPEAVSGEMYTVPIWPERKNYLDIACLCYDLSRPSPVSGEFPFAYDGEANSIHYDTPPTYTEAVLAVTRLILSAEADPAGDAQPVVPLSAEKDAQLQRELQEAIDAILKSETRIVHSDTAVPGETYTGTAYYVSAEGNDNNDGLSPDKPWKTLRKVCSEAGGWEYPGVLESGDAVFFRRGDVFRVTADQEERTLNIRTSGLTFSAYGKGAKPIITGSSQSGVGAEKWTLEAENQTTGAKIWKFYQDLRDVACIVLNDGETITKRVYEFHDGKNYESCDCDVYLMHLEPGQGVKRKGILLSPLESLTEDMTIISRPVPLMPGTQSEGVGPLYFRCDRGNPGELFSSIEFTEIETLGLVSLTGAADTVFDNISFRCNGNSYIKPTGFGEDELSNWTAVRRTLIQNCEFAFGGGSVSSYAVDEQGGAVPYIMGDGIYNIVEDTTIRNNYSHDALSTAATFECYDFYPPYSGYYHVQDNVIVNTLGLRLDSVFEPLRHLPSVVIRGNRIWNTGRMDNGCYYYSEGALLLSQNDYGEYIVEDNVFYGTENGYESDGILNFAISTDLTKMVMPSFANNTYVQHRGRYFMYFLSKDGAWNIDDPDLMYMVRRYLRDTTSEFYVMD